MPVGGGTAALETFPLLVFMSYLATPSSAVSCAVPWAQARYAAGDLSLLAWVEDLARITGRYLFKGISTEQQQYLYCPNTIIQGGWQGGLGEALGG